MKGQSRFFIRFLTTAYFTLFGVLFFGCTAFAAESIEEDTVIEEDTELTEDTVISKDAVLTVAGGVTLTVPEDVTLTIYGCLDTEDEAVVVNNGTIKYSKSADYDSDVIEGDGDVIPLSDQTYRSVDVRKVFEDPTTQSVLS